MPDCTKLYLPPWLPLLTALLFFSCRSTERTVVAEHEQEQGYYQSATGSEVVRAELIQSFESIKRLHNQVAYRTYVFDEDSNLTRQEVLLGGIETFMVDDFTDTHSNAGTGVILSHQDGRTLMMTVAHSVTYPDTVWHYRAGPDATDGVVEAVSVSQYKSHYIFGPDGMHSFEPIAADRRSDLAVLKKEWHRESDPGFTPLNASPGDIDRLDWTDRLYALGFPKGFQMITSAMVSRSPSAGARMRFMVDAPMNRGFSGGPLFAVRGDGSGLEWVGVLSAAHAETGYRLVPQEMRVEEYNPRLEYDGPVYVKRETEIRYGITYAVGLDGIRHFLEQNPDLETEHGLQLPGFSK